MDTSGYPEQKNLWYAQNVKVHTGIRREKKIRVVRKKMKAKRKHIEAVKKQIIKPTQKLLARKKGGKQ